MVFGTLLFPFPAFHLAWIVSFVVLIDFSLCLELVKSLNLVLFVFIRDSSSLYNSLVFWVLVSFYNNINEEAGLSY